MSHKMLVITIGETDRWEDVPLYEAIARKLIQLKAPGATVNRGIMGFGSHQKRLHRQQLFGVSDDRPVTIAVVQEESALRATTIPAIREMVKHGLIYLMDVELIPPAQPASNDETGTIKLKK